jgi:hypothetical protein
MRSFWWEEHFFNKAGSDSRIAMFTSNIAREDILNQVLFSFPNQVKSNWSRFLRFICPLNRLRRWFIFLPLRRLRLLLLFLLFIFPISRFRH